MGGHTGAWTGQSARSALCIVHVTFAQSAGTQWLEFGRQCQAITCTHREKTSYKHGCTCYSRYWSDNGSTTPGIGKGNESGFSHFTMESSRWPSEGRLAAPRAESVLQGCSVVRSIYGLGFQSQIVTNVDEDIASYYTNTWFVDSSPCVFLIRVLKWYITTTWNVNTKSEQDVLGKMPTSMPQSHPNKHLPVPSHPPWYLQIDPLQSVQTGRCTPGMVQPPVLPVD